jgi:ABC-2 type transport system permease protein
MGMMLAIARREFRAFFNSPIAYIVLGGFLLTLGWFYFSTLFVAGQASMRGFFGLAPVLFVVFIPAITMRLIAEERKTGTLELLLTMPLHDWQVVVGKFFAAMGMVGVGLLLTLPYALSVAALTAEGASFDWGPVAMGYLGLMLMASSFLSIGMWASALSKNQIVGFIVGLVICFAFYFVDKFAVVLPQSLAAVLQYLSVDYHFENISKGVLDSRDVLYYVTITVIALGLTARSVNTTRQ